MKIKILALGLIYLFMSLFLFCLQIDFANFTPEDASKYMEKKLRRSYDFRVKSDLKEGKVNFLFDLKTQVKTDNDLEDFTMEIVILVGEITKKSSWQSDKAIVFFKTKPFFWIYTKDCREAVGEVHDLDRMKFIATHLHYFKKSP